MQPPPHAFVGTASGLGLRLDAQVGDDVHVPGVAQGAIMATADDPPLASPGFSDADFYI